MGKRLRSNRKMKLTWCYCNNLDLNRSYHETNHIDFNDGSKGVFMIDNEYTLTLVFLGQYDETEHAIAFKDPIHLGKFDTVELAKEKAAETNLAIQ